MKIEEMAKRFANLSSKSLLSKGELVEARDLMRQLKLKGMSNEEIAELSGGKWTSSTVKGYTKGVKAGTSNEWQSAVNLFDELMAANMTLEDVEAALAVNVALGESHVSLAEVGDLLIAADSASVDKATLIQFHKELKQAALSVQHVAEVLSFKKQLEGKGLGLDSLGSILEVTKAYGELQDIMDAILSYGSLAEIEQQITTATTERDNLNGVLASAHDELEAAKNKASQLKEMMQACNRAARLGFPESQLTKLADLTRKHGTVESVFKVVEACTNYMDTMHMVKEAKADLVAKKAEIDKLEADYAHLKTVTTMCQNLIYKHKFGLDAVAMIFSTAEKYGDPIQVLETIERYGKIEAMEQKLRELEGKVTAREEMLAQLRGKVEETLQELESLHVTALKVGSDVSKVQCDVAKSKELAKIITMIEEPAQAGYQDFIPTVVPVVAALRTWFEKHAAKFKLQHKIKDGLDNLLRELKGD